jgi:hypothetical protein
MQPIPLAQYGVSSPRHSSRSIARRDCRIIAEPACRYSVAWQTPLLGTVAQRTASTGVLHNLTPTCSGVPNQDPGPWSGEYHQCSPPWPRICRCLAPKKKKVGGKKKKKLHEPAQEAIKLKRHSVSNSSGIQARQDVHNGGISRQGG